MTANGAAAFAMLLKAAARQRLLVQARLGDKQFIATGGHVLHAVDTDVIVLYTAPGEMTDIRTTYHSERYSQVFPDDAPWLAEALGRALVQYIFFKLTNSEPLLVLPPMEQEVRRVFAGMVHDARKQLDKAAIRIDKLRKLVEDLSRQSASEAIGALAEKAENISRFLAGPGGAGSQLRRFGELLAETRIGPLQLAISKGWVHDSDIRDVLSPAQSFSDRVRLRELREAWFERLYSEKGGTADKVKIYDDAQVLALLEWANSRLDEASHRIVLITGAASLYRAARKYIPKDRVESFSGLYLRHPRTYLAEPGVLSLQKEGPDSTRSAETEFLGWLDTFLGHLEPGIEKYPDRLEELIEKQDSALTEAVSPLLQTHPRILEEFNERWASYTRHLVLAHESEVPAKEPPLGTKPNLDDRGKLAVAIRSQLDRLDKELNKRLRETWQACFVAATKAGFGLLLSQQAALPPQNVPALSFDSLKKAQQFVETIKVPREGGNEGATTHDRAIAGLREEDPSEYTFYLAHALLFATDGRWRVAAILSERALRVAQDSPDEHISGREAAYLQAVAIRHSAGNVHDLSRARPLLDKAKECLEQERRKRPLLQAGESRFQSERLALFVTYHLFRLFLNKHIPDDVPKLSEVQTAIEKQMGEVEAQLDTLGVRLAAQARESAEIRVLRRERWIARNVYRQLFTNLFMAVLSRWGKEKETVDPTGYRAWFDRYNVFARRSEQPKIESSFLAEAIYMTAGWWTESDDHKKKHWRRRLRDHLMDDDEIENNTVFPYDLQRFYFLRELASRTDIRAGRQGA